MGCPAVPALPQVVMGVSVSYFSHSFTHSFSFSAFPESLMTARHSATCWALPSALTLPLWLLKTSSKHSHYGLFLRRFPGKSLNSHNAVLLWALPACYLCCFVLGLPHTQVIREFHFAPPGRTGNFLVGVWAKSRFSHCAEHHRC